MVRVSARRWVWWVLLALSPCAGRSALVSVSSNAPSGGVILSYDTNVYFGAVRTSDAGNLYAAVGQTVLLPDIAGPESNWVISAFTVRSDGFPTNASTANPTLNLKVFAWSSADPNAQGALWTNGTVATIPAQWAPMLYDYTYDVGGPIVSGQYVTVPIIGSLSLDENAAYAFLLDYDDAVDTGTGFQMRVVTGNPVAQGMVIQAVESWGGKNYVESQWDMVYYLQGIPEPSAAAGAALCGLCAMVASRLAAGRRHGSRNRPET